ncbi:hypothetical protein NQZ79_g8794 [Umbelopsis isabellina]|nr:hypothetical protein NQZ79_g8794 [Umbelopsis isabellina]
MRFSLYLLLTTGLACFASARILPNTAQSVLAVQTLDVEQVDIVPIVKPLTHSCTVNIVTHVVGTGDSQTYNHTYQPPKNCPGPWNKVVLTYTGASKGRQYDRLSSIWMGGVEILRTSTAEPTLNGINWEFQTDVTKYSSLFKTKQPLVMEMWNVLNDIYNGSYHITTDLTFYSTNKKYPASQAADIVVPISSATDGQAWFSVSSDSDLGSTNVTLPTNIQAAYLEVYASGQSNDEFWYSNPPSDYSNEINSTGIGNGPFREVLAYFDGRLIGSTVPHPVIFTGGIVPSLWRPTVSIGGAFAIPSTWIDVSPFVAWMVDGKSHQFSLQVINAEYFWLLDANLHLWLDNGSKRTSGAVLTNSIKPNATVHIESDVKKNLDAVFKVKASRSTHAKGYIDTSKGRVVNEYSYNLDYQNTLTFQDDADNSSWAQTARQITKSQHTPDHSSKGGPLAYSVSTDYSWMTGGGNNFTVFPDQSIRIDGWINSEDQENFTEKLGHQTTSTQFDAQQHGTAYYAANSLSNANQTSGNGQTKTSVTFRDGNRCYSRSVSASNSTIVSDKTNNHC